MNPFSTLHVLSLAVLFAGAATAQGTDAVFRSCGATAVNGEVRACGPNWSARFDDLGIEFTPTLGQRADRPYPLRFVFESVHRGAEVAFQRDGARVAPARRGDRITYTHAGGPVEVYDVRPDGVEQSFVFATRPLGTGDLVVRGRVTTELLRVAAGDDGVRYERAGVGGVSFGTVTGVDHCGTTVRGSIRCDGDHVEWVLPGSFVDTAAYPLVLDPLIGNAFTVADTPGVVDSQPSVAFDDTTDRYLVVWNVFPAASTAQVRGQLVAANGALVGSTMLLGQGLVSRQAVGNCNGTNRFLVAYHHSDATTASVHVVAVDAATGAVSNDVVIESTTPQNAVFHGAVVGGDSRPAGTAQSMLLVYSRNGIARSHIVQLPATGDPVPAPFQVLVSNTVDLAVTAHGGPSLQWLLTWSEKAPGTLDLGAAMIGSTGALCSPELTVSAPQVPEVARHPTNASADGTTFFIAWLETNAGSEDVRGAVLQWTGSCGTGTLTAGATFDPTIAAGLNDEPAAAFAKDKFVLAFRNRASPTATSRILVKGLDPQTCAACGIEHEVEPGAIRQDEPALAARYTAGDLASDQALVVWSIEAIRGRRFEALGSGSVASMGGACGITGLQDFATYNTGPAIGNLGFALELANPSGQIGALVIGLSAISVPCGACTIVPALDAILAGVSPNPLPLPCDLTLLGVEFYTQWVLLKPGYAGCPLLPDLALSNALRFTIGE
ncbi:MAG: hypothetical protein JNM25_11045 [Planctomycetes bacterium]|nr:hypothetical protein [Planctomycetota bacterium]